MHRTFLECKEVKAVISIGCCYNLVSEDTVQIGDECGFPMSKGVRSSGLSLGKSARDLACQVLLFHNCSDNYVEMFKDHRPNLPANIYL